MDVSGLPKDVRCAGGDYVHPCGGKLSLDAQWDSGSRGYSPLDIEEKVTRFTVPRTQLPETRGLTEAVGRRSHGRRGGIGNPSDCARHLIQVTDDVWFERWSTGDRNCRFNLVVKVVQHQLGIRQRCLQCAEARALATTVASGSPASRWPHPSGPG